MKQIILILYLFSIKPAVLSDSQDRSLTSFQQVSVSDGIVVKLEQGIKEKAKILTAETNYLSNIITKVVDGQLKIYRAGTWKLWDSRRNSEVIIYLTYNKLERIEASTGSSIHGMVYTQNMTISSSMGGRIRLRGCIEQLNANASTGGVINCLSVQVCELNSSVSTGGQVRVTVDWKLNARLRTGGVIEVNGQPEVNILSKSTGGKLKFFGIDQEID